MKKPMLCFKNPKTAFSVALCFALLVLSVVLVASSGGDALPTVGAASDVGNSVTALLRSLLR